MEVPFDNAELTPNKIVLLATGGWELLNWIETTRTCPEMPKRSKSGGSPGLFRRQSDCCLTSHALVLLPSL